MSNPVQTHPTNPTAVRTTRRLDIDNAKAVAIFFVVLGHISIANSPAWALNIRFFIYNFHMPLFMYLSGYVFFLHIMRHDHRSVWVYTRTRAKRLLGLFAVMGIIVVNIKYFSRGLGTINRSSYDYMEGYKYLILDTQKSPSLDLWYLVVLFLFSVFTYALFRLQKATIYAALLIGLILYAVFAATETTGGLTDDFYVSRICWFYIFFMIGCVASANWQHLEALFKLLWPFSLLGLALAEWGAYAGVPVAGSGWRFLICGVFSIVGFHGLWLERSTRLQPLLTYISVNTLIIYLTNTMVIALAMNILSHAVDVRSHMGLAYIILTPLGLFIPCLARSLARQSRMTSWLLPYIS